MTSDLRLYLVKADRTDYSDFDCAAVYATDADDAIAIVRTEIERCVTGLPPAIPPALGQWEPPVDGAVLTAIEVPTVRGPVLGHAKPC